ncbi:AmmeMemoRadiSam system radical SAM enzyme [Olsenella sp. An290]|uniref:AmmeMemoRadiSam system radical SAM enzyme n=1 Tax=Olsenella sp. An290 TaxID=1965625 RepID=UPI000B383DB6|nr:AmmeMemoRadiSam system radical SAM enzyme [Olsenella sp. An290]OUO34139.1 AmmeMemoRadiSam system radical SAM enzyme [Olsenella sp. An290]
MSAGEGCRVARAGTAICDVCPRHCHLGPGALGACRARRSLGGAVVPEGYGRVTSIALDPVEKKPLARFMPGAYVVSVGGYGCNLRCPFCQNWEISQAGEKDVRWREVMPDELVSLAAEARRRDPRVLGIAYTYNEPLVCWEYVRDCARLAHEAGLVNVLVSNGCVEPGVLDGLAGLVDAANIDLKGFSDAFYDACGAAPGSFSRVRATIERLAADPTCHLEVTTLVIPGMNDSEGEGEAIARWLAGLGDVPYHVTRFFPCWRMADRPPTPVSTVRHLADVARRHLAHVFVGNC